MNCENCSTWNPDDKTKCWRCGVELPKPPEPKKRRQVNSQTWVWVVAILFFVVTMLIQCDVFQGGDAGDQVGALWQAGSRLLRSVL